MLPPEVGYSTEESHGAVKMPLAFKLANFTAYNSQFKLGHVNVLKCDLLTYGQTENSH